MNKYLWIELIVVTSSFMVGGLLAALVTNYNYSDAICNGILMGVGYGFALWANRKKLK